MSLGNDYAPLRWRSRRERAASVHRRSLLCIIGGAAGVYDGGREAPSPAV